ncbi:hypothetical protein F5Y18DRAFT_368304 [Xylariaceae sp. FL1019]|nr:hypothetical protein F5Y18DRAFT_368304 [Xylariaceae sp. FL1019]
MQISFLVPLCSVTLSVLALAPGVREPALATSPDSRAALRRAEVVETASEKYDSMKYSHYLPELPIGWPNMTTSISMGTKTQDKSLAIRSKGDISIRDDPNQFGKYLFLGLKISAVIGAGVNWYGLVQSCSEFTQETGNGVQCVWGAISQVIAIVTLAYQGATWRGQLAQHLNNNGWHVPGINKRSEWAGTMARELSDGLKTEIRHLGTWTPSKTNQKRDSEDDIPREVFGLRAGDQDFHFTYMGRDIYGRDSWKLGFGDGSSPLRSTTKGRRQLQVTDGNFYFTTGGIDFAAQSVEASTSTEWSWGSTSDAVEFGDIYNSVNCYLSDGGDSLLQENNAIAFQVYDSYVDFTLSAGVMSPFSADKESAIRHLSISGGIGSNDCGTF